MYISDIEITLYILHNIKSSKHDNNNDNSSIYPPPGAFMPLYGTLPIYGQSGYDLLSLFDQIWY